MSIHIVDVCGRCGSRDMSPAITPEVAFQFAAVLPELVIAGIVIDDAGQAGCQNCDPTKTKRQSSTEGRLRAIWDGSTTP